ncbi:MAG: acyl-CoA thioesterase [Saprospiraceae bacterium]|nr:acyl-CoA thioesterase [Saprospiraceae bacterium]
MVNKPIQHTRVRFKDCDPFGHLYNTRFIEYMLEAREDLLLKHYQFDLMEYSQNTQQVWVITKHEIAYLREARRNEIISLDSSLLSFDDKKLKVEYQIWNESKDQLKCLLWTDFLHLELPSKRTIAHPSGIMELLENMCEPIQQMTLTERIQALIKSGS